jgi:hypothetical protein
VRPTRGEKRERERERGGKISAPSLSPSPSVLQAELLESGKKRPTKGQKRPTRGQKRPTRGVKRDLIEK